MDDAVLMGVFEGLQDFSSDAEAVFHGQLLLVEEPVAYPWATLCAYLIAKGHRIVARRWRLPSIYSFTAKIRQ